jgi:serine phosphatase RsbU (regulator of sigma subunit)/integral membrane sensor domain MASE1
VAAGPAIEHGAPEREAGVLRLHALGNATLFVGVTVTYMALAFAAYELFGALTIGVTFFPPAGLTFACLLVLPLRRWPIVAAAIVVGEVTVNLVEDQDFWWSLGWATANTVEPIVGAIVARHLIRDFSVDRTLAKGFLVGGVTVGPAVGATIGATVLVLSNDFGWFDGWIDVWVGDALGVLVVGPAVMVLVLPWPRSSAAPRTLDLAIGVVAVSVLGILFFVTDGVPLGYVGIPVLAWVALRLGSRGLAVAAVLLASLATAATARERGPWAATADVDAQEQLGRQQFFLLAAIGGAWILALEVRRRVHAVEQAGAARAELERALERADLVDQVQRTLVPRRLLHNEHVRVAGAYLPASNAVTVGGDWYEMTEIVGGTVNLVVGDVVGHGVEAAALMGQLGSATRALAMTNRDPAVVVDVLDRLAAETPGAAGSTLVIASFDPLTSSVCYCCAGHPPPLVRLEDGAIVVLDGAVGPPLGWARAARRHGVAELPAGSALLMYTDGLIEWRTDELDRRLATLRERFAVTSGEPEQIVDAIVAAMTADQPPTDDVAVLCLAVGG